jgi:hypothetical protein
MGHYTVTNMAYRTAVHWSLYTLNGTVKTSVCVGSTTKMIETRVGVSQMKRANGQNAGPSGRAV